MKNFSGLIWLGLLPLLSVPANAGEWRLWFKGEGNHTYTGLTGDNPWEDDDSVSYSKDNYYGHSILECQPGKTLSSAFIGNAIAAIVWVPSNGEVPPSGKVSFLISSLTYVDWDISLVPESNVTKSLVGASGSLLPAQFTDYRGHLYKEYISSGVPTLITVDTSQTYTNEDGELCVDLPAHEFNVSLTLNNQSTQRAMGDIGFEYRAQQDNRNVSLSRPGAVGDETTIEDGVSVTRGDTTYSYVNHYVTPNSFPPGSTTDSTSDIPNQVTIKANYHQDIGSPGWLTYGGSNLSSTTDPNPSVLDVNFTWSPSLPDELDASGNGEDVATHRQTMPMGGLSLWKEAMTDAKWRGQNIAPTPHTITYTTTNNGDQATATAKYILTAHDPIEITLDDVDTVPVDATVFQSNGMPIVRVYDPDPAGGTINFGTGKSSGWAVTATLPGFDKFLEALGLANVTAGYESSTQTYQENSINYPTVSQGKIRYLRVHHIYNRHHVYFWAYNQAGRIKRIVNAIPDGITPPGTQIEVQHEALFDKYINDQLFWSAEIEEDFGAPEANPNAPNDDPAQPNPTLPQRSYNFS